MAGESTNGSFCIDGALTQAASIDWAHPRKSAAAGFDLLQHLLDSSPFGILVHDAGGKILIFNRQLEEITGFSAAQYNT